MAPPTMFRTRKVHFPNLLLTKASPARPEKGLGDIIIGKRDVRQHFNSSWRSRIRLHFYHSCVKRKTKLSISGSSTYFSALNFSAAPPFVAYFALISLPCSRLSVSPNRMCAPAGRGLSFKIKSRVVVPVIVNLGYGSIEPAAPCFDFRLLLVRLDRIQGRVKAPDDGQELVEGEPYNQFVVVPLCLEPRAGA